MYLNDMNSKASGVELSKGAQKILAEIEDGQEHEYKGTLQATIRTLDAAGLVHAEYDFSGKIVKRARILVRKP